MSDSGRIMVHVVVAILVNEQQQVLVALRPDHVHQGGLWEFPGGKLEPGETVHRALAREIAEELGVDIKRSEPFMRIQHEYPDKSVLLDVWRVVEFTGKPQGLEGQAIEWRDIAALDTHEFPQANRAIIHSLQFPDVYMITGSFLDQSDFERRLKNALEHGVRLIQLRIKSNVSEQQYLHFAELAKSLCRLYSARLLLNTDLDVFTRSGADGLHLSSQRMFEFQQRPVSDQVLLSVSCHNSEQLQQACRLGADMVLISPVKETSSHPSVPGIGWDAFAEWVRQVNMPAYALGGMQLKDLTMAKRSGAQGIAAISSYW
ncbi:MAG: Nudix family hydrolase [Gammaproteobacteria bacterium]|nr:Nudix family hydrolase [Gammaproteobacteria bacterium]